MPTLNLTHEQQAILTCAADTDDHILIDAKAGSGKTSTLLELLPLLRGTTLLSAFNKAIAEDIRAKAAAKLTIFQQASVNISTVHAHGLAAIKRAGLKPQVQGGKLNFILRDMGKQIRADDPFHLNTRHIARLASLAKNAGFGLQACDGRERFPSIEGDEDLWQDLVEHFSLDTELEGEMEVGELIGFARDLLQDSNRNLRMIDFDDMVYLPLLLRQSIPTYSNVLIDEAQDINATRRELAFRSLAKDGRMIAVGDPNQAIYGFTGASVDSLDRIKHRLPASTTLPLTICWRCDAAIISEAQTQVPAIRAKPGAKAGSVKSVAFRHTPMFASQAIDNEGGAPGFGDYDKPSDFLALPLPGSAILCRLNKPLVATCLGLLRRGKPARIEGRDIGAKLVGHLKKATPLYALQPLADSLLDLDTYLEAETAKLIQRKREAAIGLLEDEVDALRLLIERTIETGAPTFAGLEALIAQLFADNLPSSSLITLSSVHKSKGREWSTVYILGAKPGKARGDYMPFHRAELPWEKEQEQNLIYVAKTRAEHELVFVTGVQAAIEAGAHRQPALNLEPNS